MAKEKSILTSSLYEIVRKNLSSTKAKTELSKEISNYFDKNSDIINDSGIANRLFFLNSDKEAIFTASGLEPNQIKAVLKQTKYIGDTWKILNEPLNIAAAMMIRYFSITKDKLKEPFVIYYSFYFYA